MALSKTWNNTVYSIPQSGERGWATLTNFLAALADSAQTTNKQIVGRRVVTATPATVVATTDCYIGVNVLNAAAAVNLPAGVNGQVFIISDESGDASTYNITVTPNGLNTINGAASFVLNQDKQTIYILYSGGNWIVLLNTTDAAPISAVTDSSKIDLTVTAGVLTATIVADSLVDADINSAAAISYSKLDLVDSIVNADINSAAAITYAKLNLADSIVDADINSAAAIAYSKLNLTGTIVNADINASAAIDYSKLNLADSIVNADINSTAAIAYSKLELTDSIVDADINSASTVVFETATQTLTNKTLSGSIVSDYTEYDETTAPTTPAAGKVRIYANSTDNSLHIIDSAGDDIAIGSGGGSGVGAKNYLESSYDFEIDPTIGMVTNLTATGNRASDTTVWGSNTTSLLSQTATALRGDFSAQLVNGSSTSNFIESPMFTLDTIDVNTNQLFISFDMDSAGTSVASGDWLVQVIRYDSSGTFVENITPSITQVPSGYYNFKCAFSHSVTATDQYSVRFRSNTATARTLIIDSIIVGPQAVVEANAIGPWISYTPTFSAGFGTVTNAAGRYRRNGDSMEVVGSGTAGVPDGNAGSISIPTPFNIALSKLPLASDNNDVGRLTADSGSVSGQICLLLANPTASTTVVTLGSKLSSTNLLANPGTNTIISNGNLFSFNFKVPISQWTTTVTLAGNPSIEYASNSSSTDAADTSSFAYGAEGSTGVIATTALTVIRNKRIRFQTPIQPTDRIQIEIKTATGSWYQLSYTDSAVGIAPLQYQNSGTYGIGLTSTLINSTDLDVAFGQYAYPSGATYGATGLSWSSVSACRWRVAKYGGVGLAELAPATTTSTGSVKGGTVPGSTTGSAIATGYLGEEILSTATTSIGTSPTTLTSITLTAGTWAVCGQSYSSQASSPNFMIIGISTVTNSQSGTNGLDVMTYAGGAGANSAGGSVNPRNYHTSSSLTLYLVVQNGGGTSNHTGTIRAVRVG